MSYPPANPANTNPSNPSYTQFDVFNDGTGMFAVSVCQSVAVNLSNGWNCYGYPLNFSLLDENGTTWNFVNNLPQPPTPNPNNPNSKIYYFPASPTGYYGIPNLEQLQSYINMGYYIYGYPLQFSLLDTTGSTWNFTNNIPTPPPNPSSPVTPSPFSPATNTTTSTDWVALSGVAVAVVSLLYFISKK